MTSSRPRSSASPAPTKAAAGAAPGSAWRSSRPSRMRTAARPAHRTAPRAVPTYGSSCPRTALDSTESRGIGSEAMWSRVLFALAAVLVLAPAAQADEVRMFAVGNKHRVHDVVTYADYRNKMAALMDAGFPNRSAYVQAGVDDVASHLRPADPTAPRKALVVFPEDVGLVNMLIGSRGAS